MATVTMPDTPPQPLDRRFLATLANRPLWLDLLALVVIIVAAWKATSGVERWLDLHLDDEAFYLGHGLAFPKGGLPHASWGPLYCVWYSFVGWLASDRPLEAYYLNQKLLILLISTLLFVGLRSFKVHRVTAVLFAWLASLSELNMVTQPKVGHFAAILLMTTVVVAGHFRTARSIFATLMLGFLAAAYVRPEFFVAACLMGATLLISELRDLKRRSTPWHWSSLLTPGLGFFTVLAAFLTLGVPVGNRSFAAFGQHFSLNWTDWNPDRKLNGWTDTDIIMNEVFPGAHSVSDALKSNPGAFTHHVLDNVGELASESSWAFLTHWPILSASNGRSPMGESLLLLGVLALFGARQVYRNTLRLRSTLHEQGARLFGLLGAFGASFLAAVVIHPDRHYLISLVSCALLLALALLARAEDVVQEAPLQPAFVPASLFPVAALLILPWITPVAIPPNPMPQPGLETVKAWRSAGYRANPVLLWTNGHSKSILGKKWKIVSHSRKDRGQSFKAFLAEHGINLVAADDRMRNDSRFRDDAEWKQFLLNPADFGFEELSSSAANTPVEVRLFARTGTIDPAKPVKTRSAPLARPGP